MTLRSSTAARTASATAKFVTLLGASAKAEAWNGTKPSTLGATPSGTKLATLNLGNPTGTVTNGVFSSNAFSQDASLHSPGTPTFLRLIDSAGVVQHDIDVGNGSGNVQFSVAIATNTPIGGSFTITEGNVA